jgi:methionyl-tRNA formyltransferase
MTAIDRICIAGKNRIAIDTIAIARRYFPDDRIVVVCNANDDGVDMWQPSLRKFALEEGLPIIDLVQAEAMERLLFLSTEFDKIVRTARFAPSSTLINIHFSELPAYKGMFTSCLPILHGAVTSGCTLHLIDDGIDTGAIIAQTRFALDPTDTAKTLYAKYLAAGSRLIEETMPAIVAGTYVAQSQSSVGSTYFSKQAVNYADLRIDLRVTGDQLSRQIRAFTHRSYQMPKVHGQPISRCEVLTERSTARAGTIVAQDADQTRVATVDFVMRDDADALRRLLTRDPGLATETSDRGWSLLARAAYNGCHAALVVLIEAAPDPDLANGKGTTPLMYAKDRLLMADDPRPVAMLLAAGADPQRRDYRGKTVFDYMTNADRPRLEALLPLG